jgi:single-strand DNA-binding protein
MASFNRVILMGNLTRDIELKYTQSQLAVTEIGLAVNERVKRNNEWVDEATFVDITLWGRNAEIASEYLSKGSPVLIEGRLRLDTWETDGQKRSKLRVVCEQLRLLGGRGGGSGVIGHSGASSQHGGASSQHSGASSQHSSSNASTAGMASTGSGAQPSASTSGSANIPSPHVGSNRGGNYDSNAASHQIQESAYGAPSGNSADDEVPF